MRRALRLRLEIDHTGHFYAIIRVKGTDFGKKRRIREGEGRREREESEAVCCVMIGGEDGFHAGWMDGWDTCWLLFPI